MPRAQVGSLAKALRLLQCFTETRPEWSVSELALATGMAKGSVSKILGTFLEHGHVVQDRESRRYRLGPALLAAGRVAAGRLDVAETAAPILADLAEATGETSILMLRAGWRSVCAARHESRHPVRMAAEVGRYASLHSGASNKPILAFMTEAEIDEYLRSPYFVRRGPRSIDDRELLLRHLAEIRRQGVAESESEVEVDIHACGAPVFDVTGTVIGAVSVAGPAQRLVPRARELRAHVREAARRLSERLGWHGPWPPGGAAEEAVAVRAR